MIWKTQVDFKIVHWQPPISAYNPLRTWGTSVSFFLGLYWGLHQSCNSEDGHHSDSAWYSGEKMGWEEEMKYEKKCGERVLSGKAGEICSHPSCTEYQVCGLWLVS